MNPLDIKKFEKGLKWLLEDNRWKEMGHKGYIYTKNTHDYDEVIDKHIKYYTEILKK